MSIERKNMVKIFFIRRLLFVSFFCCFSISLYTHVFAQADNINAYPDKSIPRGNNSSDLRNSLITKALNSKDTNQDQENIGREAMEMIMEITNSNILYEKNKSSANLAFKEQKLKDREKLNKEMKEYNDKYNKKYLATFERFQKMRGQHAGYTGVHSDYSAYLQQFSASSGR